MIEPHQQQVDIAALVVSCLKADTAISAVVGTRIGQLGESQSKLPHLEIGCTGLDPMDNSDAGAGYLVTVHIWARAGATEEIETIISALTAAISETDCSLKTELKFSEIRYIESHEQHCGLVRAKLSARDPTPPRKAKKDKPAESNLDQIKQSVSPREPVVRRESL